MQGPMPVKDITPVVVAAGRSKGSVHNTCYDLLKLKHITGDVNSFRITAAGRKFQAEHCLAA
jgi:hypothetical protein